MKDMDDDWWTWGKRPGTEVWSWVNIWVILDLLSRSMLRLSQLVWSILLTRFLEVVLAVFSAMVEGWRIEEGGIWESGGMVEWVSVSFAVVWPCIFINNILPTLLIPIMFIYQEILFCFVLYSYNEIDEKKKMGWFGLMIGLIWIDLLVHACSKKRSLSYMHFDFVYFDPYLTCIVLFIVFFYGYLRRNFCKLK